MPTIVVPDLGDVTDTVTIQQIYDDVSALEEEVTAIGPSGTIVARGRRITNAGPTSAGTELPVLRVDDIPVIDGRLYYIYTNPMLVDGSVANDIPRVSLRVDETGSAATVADTLMAIQQLRLADPAVSETTEIGILRTATATGLWSVLLTLTRAGGTGVCALSGATVPIDLIIMDCGEDVGDTGVDL